MLIEYRIRRDYRKLQRHLTRVMFLDELLRKRASCNRELAEEIKAKIRHHQQEIEALYDELGLLRKKYRHSRRQLSPVRVGRGR